MARIVRRGRPFRLSHEALGERLGGFIYGTIVVLGALVAGARAYPDGAGQIAGLVVATTVIFWVAHVYAHGLGQSVTRGQRLSPAQLRRIARHEASIIEAGVPSLLALVLGAVGLLSTSAAVWLAFGLGLLVLAVEGVVFARVERLGWLGTAGVVGANVGLGLVLVAVKLIVTH